MSRPRKYTPNTLKKAVNGYFDSISRLVPLTEKRNTGRKDSDGHVIYEEVPVLNRLGVQATVLEYLVPPTVGGLCEHLGIHRSTWADYRGEQRQVLRLDRGEKQRALLRGREQHLPKRA